MPYCKCERRPLRQQYAHCFRSLPQATSLSQGSIRHGAAPPQQTPHRDGRNRHVTTISVTLAMPPAAWNADARPGQARLTWPPKTNTSQLSFRLGSAQLAAGLSPESNRQRSSVQLRARPAATPKVVAVLACSPLLHGWSATAPATAPRLGSHHWSESLLRVSHCSATAAQPLL